uniref:LTD domain-containing protein n=1 Tax=Strongyloides stercoralis TaxID=6248 RepID=A0A0K0DVE4_STRER
MSTVTPKKITKRTTRKTTREASVATNESTSSSKANMNTSTSPIKRTRVQEKYELGNLNNRLANYIDTVRRLESEKYSLECKLQEVETTYSTRNDKICTQLENELQDVRDRLDQLNRENATLTVERDRAEARLRDVTSQLTDWKNKAEYGEIFSDQQKVKLKALEGEIKNLKDKLAFAEKSYQAEITEIKKTKIADVSAIHRDAENKYHSQFEEQMNALRKDYEDKFQASRQDIDNMYRSKLNEANEAVKYARENSAKATEEAAHLKIRISSYESSQSTMEKTISDLKQKLSDSEDKVAGLRSEMNKRIAEKDLIISDINQDIKNLMEQYRDLMDIKVQLDVELDAYRHLLEGEETRLNITNVSGTDLSNRQDLNSSSSFLSGSVLRNFFGSERRTTKRPRLDEAQPVEQVIEIINDEPVTVVKNYSIIAESFGALEIAEVDTEGAFVKIQNKGTTNVSLEGYKLRLASLEKDVIYKFTNKQPLVSNGTVTVYSANAGFKHNPPSNLVMKNQEWLLGDAFKLELIDFNDEVVAFYEGKSTSTKELDPVREERESCRVM